MKTKRAAGLKTRVKKKKLLLSFTSRAHHTIQILTHIVLLSIHTYPQHPERVFS